jgi:protein gp37
MATSEQLPLDDVRRVFDAVGRAHWYRFQLLTKRSERLVELAPQLNWPANVWMGVSVERDEFRDRIYCLRQVPAAVRFLSLEPLMRPSPDLDLAGIH